MLEERTFETIADGKRVRARTIPSAGGAAHAPTLVFLHEGLGSIDQWRDFPRALALETGLAALVYDRPGFGGSHPLPQDRDPLSLQREDAAGLAALLDACGVETPILIGHSDGGTIALLYAARFPQRPAAVIVEAAHVFVEEITVACIAETVREYRTGNLRERLARYHGDKTDALFGAWSHEWLLPQFRDWNIEASLASIVCPVLAIQGEEDEYGTRAQVEAIRSGVSGRAETLMIPGCGHNPHLRAGETVLREMTRFISGLQLPDYKETKPR